MWVANSLFPWSHRSVMRISDRLLFVKKDLLGEVRKRITSALLSYSKWSDEQKTVASPWKHSV